MKKLNILIPVFNEAEGIRRLVESVAAEVEKLDLNYSFIIVDDGSDDDSWQQLEPLCEKISLRFIRLTRNFGKEAAITAGLDHVNADACVIMDGDGQHNPKYIETFVSYWQQGFDIVTGIRNERHEQGFIRRTLSEAYYKMLSSKENQVVANAGDFRLLSKRVVKQLNSLQEKARMMKGLYGWGGYKNQFVPIEIEERETGVSKFRIYDLFNLGMSGITSFSTKPLRLILFVGLLVSALSVIYSGVLVFETLVYGVDVPGWSTLAVGVFFIGGLNLFFMGIIGEYLAEIFKEVKNRPIYLVDEILGGDESE